MFPIAIAPREPHHACGSPSIGWTRTIPERREQWEFPVNALGDFLRVDCLRDGKSVVRFTVQYEALIDGEERPFVRYDTARGFAHRDTLRWDGTTAKKARMPQTLDFAQAMTEAIADVRTNWERYRAGFLRRRP